MDINTSIDCMKPKILMLFCYINYSCNSSVSKKPSQKQWFGKSGRKTDGINRFCYKENSGIFNPVSYIFLCFQVQQIDLRTNWCNRIYIE